MILAGGFALAVAAVPAVAAFAVPTSGPSTPLACIGGEELDVYSGICLPHTVPNSPFTTNAANPNIPESDGVPCVGADYELCLDESVNTPDYVPPTSSVGSSPTIDGSI